MSDISINVPFWLVLILASAQVWPVFLMAFGLAVGLGVVFRGWARVAAFELAALLAAYLAVMGVFLLA